MMMAMMTKILVTIICHHAYGLNGFVAFNRFLTFVSVLFEFVFH